MIAILVFIEVSTGIRTASCEVFSRRVLQGLCSVYGASYLGVNSCRVVYCGTHVTFTLN